MVDQQVCCCLTIDNDRRKSRLPVADGRAGNTEKWDDIWGKKRIFAPVEGGGETEKTVRNIIADKESDVPIRRPRFSTVPDTVMFF